MAKTIIEACALCGSDKISKSFARGHLYPKSLEQKVNGTNKLLLIKSNDHGKSTINPISAIRPFVYKWCSDCETKYFGTIDSDFSKLFYELPNLTKFPSDASNLSTYRCHKTKHWDYNLIDTFFASVYLRHMIAGLVIKNETYLNEAKRMIVLYNHGIVIDNPKIRSILFKETGIQKMQNVGFCYTAEGFKNKAILIGKAQEWKSNKATYYNIKLLNGFTCLLFTSINKIPLEMLRDNNVICALNLEKDFEGKALEKLFKIA